jgi:hypothetical protein
MLNISKGLFFFFFLGGFFAEIVFEQFLVLNF